MDYTGAIVTQILAAIGIIILACLLATPAKTSAVCLTKDEARKLWPKQHIYWYSADHCWSNRRGEPPRGIKIEKISEVYAKDTKPILPAPTYDVLPPPRPEEDFCCWPILKELNEYLKDHLIDYLRGYQK